MLLHVVAVCSIYVAKLRDCPGGVCLRHLRHEENNLTDGCDGMVLKPFFNNKISGNIPQCFLLHYVHEVSVGI
jgi:hypothetical protein